MRLTLPAFAISAQGKCGTKTKHTWRASLRSLFASFLYPLPTSLTSVVRSYLHELHHRGGSPSRMSPKHQGTDPSSPSAWPQPVKPILVDSSWDEAQPGSAPCSNNNRALDKIKKRWRDGASFTTGSQTQNVLGPLSITQVRCGEQATIISQYGATAINFDGFDHVQI